MPTGTAVGSGQWSAGSGSAVVSLRGVGEGYEDLLAAQIAAAVERGGRGNLEKLINSGDTWVVEG
ncbi:MAG TPA: hypothetical protein VF546_06240 [Pyrinomonadaceae bacterium]|jgi:hypothetical protein